MALITDYASLQTEVANWMHRSDLTGNIPTFIQLAEARIKALLEASFTDVAATFATVSGQNYATMPSDLLRAHSLSIRNVAPVIDYVTPQELSRTYFEGDVGTPRKYTIIGDRIYIGPTPDSVYTVSCTYQSSVPSLSVSAPTNTLLTRWPQVYLWASLTEAAKFSRDRESAAAFGADFNDAIGAVNVIEWHKGGSMTQRSDVRSF